MMKFIRFDRAIAPEMAEMEDLLEDLERGESKSMRKKATFQNYNKRRSRQ